MAWVASMIRSSALRTSVSPSRCLFSMSQFEMPEARDTPVNTSTVRRFRAAPSTARRSTRVPSTV